MCLEVGQYTRDLHSTTKIFGIILCPLSDYELWPMVSDVCNILHTSRLTRTNWMEIIFDLRTIPSNQSVGKGTLISADKKLSPTRSLFWDGWKICNGILAMIKNTRNTQETFYVAPWTTCDFLNYICSLSQT